MLEAHPLLALLTPFHVPPLLQLVKPPSQPGKLLVFLRGETVALDGLQRIGEALSAGIDRTG
jgi:hypothetical protein